MHEKICRENNVIFIVNDYVDVALEIRADGVHLGQSDMPIKEARGSKASICLLRIEIYLVLHLINEKELGFGGFGVAEPPQTLQNPSSLSH